MITTAHFTVCARGKHVGQDAALAREDCDYAVLCVADGAGGSPGSELGALLAVHIAVQAAWAFRPFNRPALVQSVTDARGRWLASLDNGRARHSARDTTIALSVVRPGHLLVAAIGDAFAVTTSESAQPPRTRLVFGLGRSAEGSANDTAVWSQSTWMADMRVLEVRDPELRGVFLSTDGLEKVAIAHGSVGPPSEQKVGPVGVLAGTVDRLFELCREGRSGRSIAAAVADNDVIMTSKGDDIGVAMATW